MSNITLRDITNEQLLLEEMFAESIDEETGEITDMEQIEELKSEIDKQIVKKSNGIVYFIREREMTVDSINSEIKRLQSLKKNYENKTKRFKEYVTYSLEKLGLTKVETPMGILSLRKSSSVNVIDEGKLDMKYMKEKIEFTVDKTKIKKDIKNGVAVNGAYIVDKNNLQIK